MSLQLFKDALRAAAKYYLAEEVVDLKRRELDNALIEYRKVKIETSMKTKELFIELKICADDIIICEGIAYKLRKMDYEEGGSFLKKVPNTINIDKLPDTFI